MSERMFGEQRHIVRGWNTIHKELDKGVWVGTSQQTQLFFSPRPRGVGLFTVYFASVET